MKTLKFRLIEHVVRKGYTTESKWAIQYKVGMFWEDYSIDNGGIDEIKKFKSVKDCTDELFEKCRWKKTEVRLKEYPQLKITTIQ